ncbi:TIGR01777 family oxidoreductase [Myroides indicus]|uniref:TIGR01777 family protein n=1 Tax=Myroides indicus TaxID=1323422 RepID=A0A4R7EWA9_9FLAO|nr:TIGR01777 family oxidoreductase [Myroides indicus]TDS57544.1 hypothetical protein C8P70_11543 [Myroides indicus]
MKILITGATGFIGKKLVKVLLNRGFDIHYLTTSADKIKKSDRYKGFFWNPSKNEIDTACLQGVEVIIHLAGANISGSWSKAGKKKIEDSRVIPTCFLNEKLKNTPHKVKRVIAASAIGIYEDIGQVQTEANFNLADNFLGNVVQKWETASLSFSKQDIEVCIIRIGLVLSADGGALPIMAKVTKNNLGSVAGNGKQYYSWIHIEDLLGIFEYAINNKLSGVYNAVAPVPETNQVFTYTLAEVLHKKVYLTTPSWLLKLLLGEKSLLLLGGQNVSCSKIVKKGYYFKYPKLKNALIAIFS